MGIKNYIVASLAIGISLFADKTCAQQGKAVAGDTSKNIKTAAEYKKVYGFGLNRRKDQLQKNGFYIYYGFAFIAGDEIKKDTLISDVTDTVPSLHVLNFSAAAPVESGNGQFTYKKSKSGFDEIEIIKKETHYKFFTNCDCFAQTSPKTSLPVYIRPFNSKRDTCFSIQDITPVPMKQYEMNKSKLQIK